MERRLLAGAAVWALILCSGASARAQSKDHFEVGDSLPVFGLKTVNPDESGVRYIGLDSYVGESPSEPKKALLISFFATYCEPCKREMPLLAALYDSYRDKGLAILSVSIDKESDKVDFIKKLASDSGAKFPVLSDRFNIVAKRYMISRLPCVYIAGADGKVAMASVGYSDDVSSKLVETVRKMVGESPSEPVPAAVAKAMETSHGSAESETSVAAHDLDAPTEAATAAAAEAQVEKAPPVRATKTKGKRKGRRRRRGN